MPNGLTQIANLFSVGAMVHGSGLAAYVLLFFIVAGGLIISLQWIPPKHRAAFLNYHRLISFAALILLILHCLAYFISKYERVAWADILVPFWTSHKRAETAAGIIAAYTMAALTLSSISASMKAIGRECWRVFHYLAFPCFVLSLYHGVVFGISSNVLFMMGIYPATTSIVASLVAMRIWKSIEKRRFANENSVG
jgi:methionine sulfoxide reductase heme-binding subunit